MHKIIIIIIHAQPNLVKIDLLRYDYNYNIKIRNLNLKYLGNDCAPLSTSVSKLKSLQRNVIANVNHSHKKQIVWKHWPNWRFYAVMLRTKPY